MSFPRNLNTPNYTTNTFPIHTVKEQSKNFEIDFTLFCIYNLKLCFYDIWPRMNKRILSCPSCSKPLQYNLASCLIFGFIPSCNKMYECTNCKKIIVKLNWFLVIVYFHFGLGAYAILVGGFVLRFKNKLVEDLV